jgi:hypothetical protein
MYPFSLTTSNPAVDAERAGTAVRRALRDREGCGRRS